uniref:Uncharacterized protein n=1 Tax=Anguilla anguilla TaxID=7936 RepID=A0A0E9UCB6_ANGAN
MKMLTCIGLRYTELLAYCLELS